MRRGIFLIVLTVLACSRPPSAIQAYSEAWGAYRQGRLEQAQRVVDSALKSHRAEPAESLEPLRLLQTEILLARGQARAAQGLLAGLPDPRDPLLHLRWLVDRADAASKLQQGETAIALLDEVDRTAGANNSADPVLKGRLLRGSILARDGNKFDEADRMLGETAARAAAAGDAFNQAAALLNLCFSKFNRGLYDESLSYCLPLLEAAGKIHAGLLTGLANNNLGITYTVLRDLDRAEQHLTQAITQLREIGDLRDLANAFGNLGNVHLLGHQTPRAAEEFEQAVKIAKSIESIVDASRWAGQLSLAFAEQHNWDEAESWNRQAAKLNESLKHPENQLYLKLNAAAIANGRGNHADAERLYGELIDNSAGQPYLEWNGHVRLGSLFAEEGRSAEANREYERGIEVLERITFGLVQADYRLTYHDAVMEFFKDYVDLLVKEGHPEQALQVAESSRARVLIEKLGLNGAAGKVQPADFQGYARRNGEVLLSYWLAPKRSFVWVVTPSDIRMKILPGQKEIEDLIRAYQKSIVDDLRNPVEEGMPQAERLSQILLGPLQAELAGAQRVVIVPDGSLHALNLETLPIPGTSRYWIEKAEISLAPSLSMLAETPPKTGTRASILLIGAPDAVSAEYGELPAAKSEIEGIQSRFARNAQVTRMGAAATPRAFLDSMPGRFSMIHFAAHAETNSQRPLESAIILSQGGAGAGFKLYARDITGLKLSADLVTISACRSAGARAYAGEGLVGLTWAFLQTGARSVIAGLWDVSDLSSAQLMGTLYEKLAARMKPAAALRRAKLDLLHSTGAYSKPYHWAPYQTYIR